MHGFVGKIAMCALLAASGAWAQSAEPAPEKPVAPFEVVAIHRHDPGSKEFYSRETAGRIRIPYWTARNFIRYAYGLTLDSQMEGAPAWADNDRYDLFASVEASEVEREKNMSRKELEERAQKRMQAMLAERFQLRVHKIERVLPVYELLLAKSGVKFKEDKTGGDMIYSLVGDGKLRLQNAYCNTLADFLSDSVDRLVIDKTGLGEKKFDIDLTWTPDEQQGTPDAGPSLFTAVEEQLGLKLVASKAQVEVVVVDHIERPSEN